MADVVEALLVWVLELVALEDGVVIVLRPEEVTEVVSVEAGALSVVAETVVPLENVLDEVLLVPLSVPVVVLVGVDTELGPRLEPGRVEVVVVEIPAEVEIPELEPPAEPVILSRLFGKEWSMIGTFGEEGLLT